MQTLYPIALNDLAYWKRNKIVVMLKLIPEHPGVSLELPGFHCRQACRACLRPLDNEPSSWPTK